MLEVQGAPVAAIMNGIPPAEKLGAIFQAYEGGEFIVHINNFQPGSLKKLPLPTSWFSRWRIYRGGGPFQWSWQANDSDGACCASSASNRDKAIAEAKAWIDTRRNHTA